MLPRDSKALEIKYSKSFQSEKTKDTVLDIRTAMEFPVKTLKNRRQDQCLKNVGPRNSASRSRLVSRLAPSAPALPGLPRRCFYFPGSTVCDLPLLSFLFDPVDLSFLNISITNFQRMKASYAVYCCAL